MPTDLDAQRAADRAEAAAETDALLAPFERFPLGDKIREGVPEVELLLGGLVYTHGVHFWYGPPKQGKSLVCRQIALWQYERTGRPTVWVDREMGWLQTAQAFLDMGADADTVDGAIVYLEFPSLTTLTTREQIKVKLANTVNHYNAVGLTFDSAGKELAKLNLDEYSNPDVTKWTESILVPLAKSLDCPVHVIDHTTKAGRGGDGWARGAGEKMGAADLAWNVTSFDPTSKDPKDEEAAGFSRERRGLLELHSRGIDRYGRAPFVHRFYAGGQGVGHDLVLERCDLAELEGEPVL